MKKNGSISMDNIIRPALKDVCDRYLPDQTERLQEFIYRMSKGEAFTSDSPNQQPYFYYPYLNTQPWYDPSAYEATKILENSYDKIRQEMYSVLYKKTGFIPYIVDKARQEDGVKGDMNVFHLRDAFTINPEKLANNRALCPKTTEIVDALPRTGEVALFSALNPGTHLTPHCGAENLRQTIHLAITIPKGCQITVDGVSANWQEGKCIMFDDSYLHEAFNESEITRFVLLLDVWHPDLTDAEIDFFKQVGPKMPRDKDFTENLYNIEDKLENTEWWVEN